MRLQVNVSEVMVDKIDKYAEMMGISRSALCAYLIGQGIMSMSKAFDVLDSGGMSFAEQMMNQKTKREISKGMQTFMDEL